MHTTLNDRMARTTHLQGGSRNVPIDAPSHMLSYERAQLLYHNGDPATSLFRLKEGLIRIARMTPDGRNLTVRHMEPGDFFGEEALMGDTRAEIAEALTNSQVEAIDPGMISNDDLMTITHSLSRQIRRLMDDEYHLQTGDVRQRVSRYLLRLATTPIAGVDEMGRTVIEATHELIAEGTASTRESVSKIITELRNASLIVSGYRHIALVDEDGLDAIANEI